MSQWQLKATILKEGQPVFSELFEHTPVTIGGLPDNDIVLSDPFVSGQHAWVTVSRGRVTYHDRSRNGSFIGQSRIETRDLAPHETVAVPPFEMRFEVILTGEERRTALRNSADLITGPPVTDSFERPTIPRMPLVTAPPHDGPPRIETPPREVPSPTIPLYLEVTQGPPEIQGRLHPVESLRIRIGRGEDADLRFNLATLSRIHAELSWAAQGWRVEDLGSSNGTYVNDQKVEAALLNAGDTLRFGRDITVTVRHEAPGETSPPDEPEKSSQTIKPTDVPILEIRERRPPGAPQVLILEVRGRVDGYNYTVLAEKLDGAIDARERLMIVDFNELVFIDHTGLGALVNAASRLDRLKGHLRLVGIGPKLRDAFELSRLDSLFRGRLAEDEAAAVRELDAFRT